MINKVVFITFIIVSQLFDQSHKFKREEENLLKGNSLCFSEIHSIPSGSVNHVYFTYRISFARLVFIKSDDKYSASFTFSIEVTDSASKNIVRQIQTKSIFIDTFNETVNKNNYYQGIISFYLKDGSYKILPFLTDLNTGHEVKFLVKRLDVQNKNKSDIISPLVIKSTLATCKINKYFELSNFSESLPFSQTRYGLLIPCIDTTLESIFVVIKNNLDTVFNSKVYDNFKSKINLRECNDKIILGDETSLPVTKNFVIPEINNKLMEGNAEIIVSRDKSSKQSKIFHMRVLWINKPVSLLSPEGAIKMLKFIEKDSVITKMLYSDSKDYQKVLFQFWNNIGSIPGTTFNPLMEEYYTRIDYADKTFALFSGKSGIETDRGKIYIKFGKPQKITRDSNRDGKVVETWVYNNPKKKFVFIDDDGSGNFILRD